MAEVRAARDKRMVKDCILTDLMVVLLLLKLGKYQTMDLVEKGKFGEKSTKRVS